MGGCRPGGLAARPRPDAQVWGLNGTRQPPRHGKLEGRWGVPHGSRDKAMAAPVPPGQRAEQGQRGPAPAQGAAGAARGAPRPQRPRAPYRLRQPQEAGEGPQRRRGGETAQPRRAEPRGCAGPFAGGSRARYGPPPLRQGATGRERGGEGASGSPALPAGLPAGNTRVWAAAIVGHRQRRRGRRCSHAWFVPCVNFRTEPCRTSTGERPCCVMASFRPAVLLLPRQKFIKASRV
ncbi:translation initiation factor IF-2-like [Falco naumanni]|uniref:translation initiation factor IF-2-like n=1 Tax=Falco naumanni TaxID=148594 RepID=UPI001ADE783C|nr:translation initiation factor IF-2-like [Falco naumanni]